LVALATLTMLVLHEFAKSQASKGDYRDPSVFDPKGFPSDRNGVDDWEVDEAFRHDVFTFARIRYSDRYGRGYRGRWETDHPDSDLNFTFRLQQLTSLAVDPDSSDKYVELTEDRVFDYPFLYLIEPGRLEFQQEEADALRQHLFSGGFLMVDDFWGEREWDNFYREMKKVFPNREPVDVPRDHEIFSCVYDLDGRNLQIPSHGHAWSGRGSGRTWERYDAQEVHFRAYYDDDGRMVAFVCHNTDLGDGWEREGEDEWYFREFSEKKAYPLGINIVTYAMTH